MTDILPSPKEEYWHIPVHHYFCYHFCFFKHFEIPCDVQLSKEISDAALASYILGNIGRSDWREILRNTHSLGYIDHYYFGPNFPRAEEENKKWQKFIQENDIYQIFSVPRKIFKKSMEKLLLFCLLKKFENDLDCDVSLEPIWLITLERSYISRCAKEVISRFCNNSTDRNHRPGDIAAGPVVRNSNELLAKRLERYNCCTFSYDMILSKIGLKVILCRCMDFRRIPNLNHFPTFFPYFLTHSLTNGNKASDGPIESSAEDKFTIGPDVVFLTDSFEIANFNQENARQARIHNVHWLSWIGDVNQLPESEFRKLENKKIYFLLRSHSGKSFGDVFKAGEEIRMKIQRLFSKEYSFSTHFYYLMFDDSLPSLSYGFPSQIFNRPVIFRPEHLLEMARKAIGVKTVASSLVQRESAFQYIRPARRMLCRPVIKRGSVTMIYGDSGLEKNWFALSIACTAASANTIIPGWLCSAPCDVLYSSSSELLENVKEKASRLLGKDSIDVEVDDPSEESEIAKEEQNQESKQQLPHIRFFRSLQEMQHIVDFSPFGWNEARIYAGFPAPEMLIVVDETCDVPWKSADDNEVFRFSLWLKQKKLDGISLLIVYPTEGHTEKERSSFIKAIPVDTIIEVKNSKSPRPVDISLLVKIVKSSVLAGNFRKILAYSIEYNSGSPFWRRTIQSTSKTKYEFRFLDLWQRGAKETEMAEQLGIDVNKVKNDKKKFRKMYNEWNGPFKRKGMKGSDCMLMASIDSEWAQDNLLQ